MTEWNIAKLDYEKVAQEIDSKGFGCRWMGTDYHNCQVKQCTANKENVPQIQLTDN